MSWKGLRKILCLRLDGLNDILTTEPAIRALKESNPGAKMTLLTSKSAANLGRLLASVDDVIAFDAPWADAGRVSDGPAHHDLIATLRERGFDAAVIFSSHHQNPMPEALVCLLAEIPRRLAHCRENPHGLLSDWVEEVEPVKILRHEVRRQLELVASVGCHTSDERIRVKIPGDTRRRVTEILKERGVRAESPFVIVHPGNQQTPGRAETLGAIVRELSLRLNHQILLTGDEADRAILAEIQEAARVPCYALSDVFRLDELAHLFSRSTLVISSSTCALNLSTAVRTPVVDLRTQQDPSRTPWLVPYRSLIIDFEGRFQGRGGPRLAEPTQVVLAAHELLWDLTERHRVKTPKVVTFNRELPSERVLNLGS